MTIQESLVSAEEEIKPYLNPFRDCYQRAIVDYVLVLNTYTKPLYNRSKAILFQNIIINEIKAEFGDRVDVRIVEKYESISLVINNHISARFKKFNEKGLPSNHQSKRNDAIISQQMSFAFEDYPPIAWIDVGYTMDATGANFDLLKVICRRNKNILWDLYFHDATDQGDLDGNRVTIKPPTPPNNDPGTTRVTIKEGEEKIKKAE